MAIAELRRRWQSGAAGISGATASTTIDQADSKPYLLLSAGVLWLAIVLSGFALLWRYATTPGVAGHPPHTWPAASRIAREAKEFTLVMIAHPQCPWTRASIGELATLMAHSSGRLRATVLFVRPGNFDSAWVKSELWFSAAQIPGVTVALDEGGDEARRFAAATSGQTMVYDPAGRLVFSGGITAARGHWGDNRGEDAIRHLLATNATDHITTPVYGCALAGRTVKGGVSACPH